MEVYTIGFTKKTAREFFEALKRHGIKRLVDVRLNATSQLAGFAKREDLAYLLQALCDAEYVPCPELAPPEELLKGYRDGAVSWEDYEERYMATLRERGVDRTLPRDLLEGPTVLLCSEAEAERCHRRLAAEYLCAKWGGLTITHL